MRGVTVLVCLVVVGAKAINGEGTEKRKEDPELRQIGWSALSFLSQNNKRSADYEDPQDLTVASNEVLVASESVADMDVAEPRVDRYPKRRRNRYRKRPRYQNEGGSQDYLYGEDKYSDGYSKDKYTDSYSHDKYFEDRDGAPSSSYEAPSSSYNAPSYNAPSYEAPSYQAPAYEAPADSYGAPSYSSGGGGGDSFNDFLNALAAFLPIGLFLAAIPPNLIVINSARRRRSANNDSNSVDSSVEGEVSYPFLQRIEHIGYSRFSRELQCQKMIFCEMAEFGAMEEANLVQKIFGYAVAMAPDVLADTVGLKDVFQAARDGRCGKYDCQL